MPPRRGGQGGLEAKDELKAVLLADSFAQDFWPITIEVPRVLLPLANIPLIEYSLEWLASNQVEEVFVVCCVHAEQIQKHIKTSKWISSKAMKVTLVISSASNSMGDALRAIDQKGCINSDFVLISGDTVTNLDLRGPLAKHKQRRQKDSNAILTLVTKKIGSREPWQRLGYKQLLLAVDPITDQLLKYKELDTRSRHSNLDAHFFGERDGVQLHTDLLDSQIQICAPEVLMLFTDNFDYQDLRQHFIPGVLSEEELGNKLFIHTLIQEYAVRVKNLRTYDAVSRDVIQRWAFPFTLDTNLLRLTGTFGPSSYSLDRFHIYRESCNESESEMSWLLDGNFFSAIIHQRFSTIREQGMKVARSALIEHDTAIGAGTHIDEGAQVSSSTIGRGCRIGKHVIIEDSYLHDSVVVWEGAEIRNSMLCQGSTVMPGAKVLDGSVLSFKVVIGNGHIVSGNKRISLCKQAIPASDSEDEHEIPSSQAASSNFGSIGSDSHTPGIQPTQTVLQYAQDAASGNSIPKAAGFDKSVVGEGGAGILWDMRLSDKELERTSLLRPVLEDLQEDFTSDAESTSTEGPLLDSMDTNEQTEGAPEIIFKQEVSETVLRCMREGHGMQNAIVELNSLKLAENKTFAELARYIFGTIMSLVLPAPLGINSEYKTLFPSALPSSDIELKERTKTAYAKWGPLLKQYLKGSEEQIDLLLTLEEFCNEEPPFGHASQGRKFIPVFVWLLKYWYDEDYIEEESFSAWADEKKESEEHEKEFLKLAQPFLQWLEDADEEDSDDESDA